MTAKPTVRRWPIVVGVDGSDADTAAMEWAAGEAVRRRAALRLVHAQELPPWLARDPRLRERITESATERTEELFQRARGLAHARDPELVVGSQLEWGSAAGALLNAAHEAVLVVMGAATSEDQHHISLRPVASHVAAHAPCPVVVARDPAGSSAGGSVIVGVDGSRVSEQAVEFAFEEADYRGTGVVALMAWGPEPAAWPMMPEGADPQHDLAAATLAESVAGMRERYPDVPLEQRVVPSHPVRGFLDAAPEAALLVVGSHGHGWFPGLLLGSVSNALIRRSPVPLAVVRAPGHRS
ncbi:nucleotide-binding universal stress UspA family protein [Lipingzhangella halophila]|uniref:Nucleotide-binding universal stress UspA family protein n=1 Tax=Lipingzhangella halophila TaxID=1783352 RepID=A0A7W7RMW0_9ACTN|nr:universal stress protein [Lipingzhangella halophila]MBB4934915.1 nucleotide-binding universal stress UspA family protein [Lipingzhangella halophila]